MNLYSSDKQNTEGLKIPAYFRLQQQIKEKVESGQWKPGQKIASERVFAEIHQLSPGTVKKAILNLVNQGYLYRKQGLGTFVAGNTLDRRDLRYYHMKNADNEEARLKIKLLGLKKVTALPYSNFLNIGADEDCYEVQRLFLSENIPLIYAVSFLPSKLFHPLETVPKVNFENDPLYCMLEQRFGVVTVRNSEMFGTEKADDIIAKRLETMPGKNLLIIEMRSFTYNNKPYEYRKSYCLTDQYKISVKL
jgi:GntR family transcriptional regulator